MIDISVFKCNFIEENCYILHEKGGNGDCWVVDCGAWDENEVQIICNYMQKEGLRPVKHLLTHGHFDHIFGAKALEREYGLRPTMLRSERDTYLNAREQMCRFMHRELPLVVPDAAEYLDDDVELTLGHHTFRAIPTPGHTPGGCCYYCEEEKILLSGDTLFLHSYGRTDLPGGDGRLLFASLQRLLELPEDTRVLPGHGPETWIGNEQMLI